MDKDCDLIIIFESCGPINFYNLKISSDLGLIKKVLGQSFFSNF